MIDGLAEFLLARYAEDEAFALRYPPTAASRPRALAEADAHRRIVEYHAEGLVCDWTLRLLALPFAQHPDFRREWLP